MSAHPEIERILKESIGLNPASIGSPAIARAFRGRMQALGMETPEEYGRLIQRSSAEMQELIESVVVSETWFFRDGAPFTTLAGYVKSEWMPEHPNTTFCALSVPCATGEEPYSIAMGLMDGGVPANRFRVDAMDISLRVIEHAGRGVYGRNSFRTANLEFRERYFLRIEQGYQLSQLVRERVNFRPGNLLALGAIEGVYDVIFCRNLLIYFDEDAQERAISTLLRLLAPDGLLFVGHAEIPLLTRRGFDASDFPGAFACRKRVNKAPPKRTRPVIKSSVPVVTAPRIAAHSHSANIRPLPAPPSTVPSPADSGSDLDKASELADRGQLKEAAELCTAHLKSHPDSLRAHYLLALTRDAAGEEKAAAEEYRRALYLDPNHTESLVHLASLLEKNGETTAARRLIARAQRTSNNG